MKTYEEQKAIVAKLNVIDDVMFHKAAEDAEVCEEILQILMANPELKLINSQVQRYLRNIGAHSVILDALCEDQNGNYINIEVQKADDDDNQKRVRFNAANIDTTFVEKGIDYKDIPDVYVIYISAFDPFKEHETIYHIDRVIRKSGTVVNNGIHEIYVNTAVNDGSDVAELMAFFKNSVGSNPKFQKLSAKIKYFKEEKEGVQFMCKVVEEYAKNEVKEIVINMLKKGVAPEVISEYIPNFTLQEIIAIKDELIPVA